MEGISVSTDKSRLDLHLIHSFLSEESYWAKNIPYETVERSVQNSLCFGAYHNERQVAFARVITDYATFAYLADVFVVHAYRGREISKKLIETIRSFPDLQGLRRWVLATADAHGLYKQFGFTELSQPDRFMEIRNRNIYRITPSSPL